MSLVALLKKGLPADALLEDTPMNQLNTIRKYLDYQQYAELGAAARAYWDETGQASALPLLLLSYVHLGRRDKANETLALIRARQTRLDTDALVDFGGALLVMLRLDQAVEMLELALARQPGHGLGTARLAWCRMAMGDLDAARHLFTRAVELEPGRIPILNNLAMVCLLQKDPEQAQQVVNQARNSLERQRNDFPDFVIHQYDETLDLVQVQIWVDQERFALAEEWLEGLRQGEESHDPDQEPAILVRVGHYARMLAEADRHDQAGDVLKAYLKYFPGNGNLLRQMAELAQVQGRFVQAAALLRRAIKKDEHNIDLWVQLSQSCLYRFDGQARRAAEKAMELAGALTESDGMPAFKIKASQARAKNALAQVESHEQNYNTAEKMFRDILADHEFFVPALQGLGQLQMQRG